MERAFNLDRGVNDPPPRDNYPRLDPTPLASPTARRPIVLGKTRFDKDFPSLGPNAPGFAGGPTGAEGAGNTGAGRSSGAQQNSQVSKPKIQSKLGTYNKNTAMRAMMPARASSTGWGSSPDPYGLPVSAAATGASNNSSPPTSPTGVSASELDGLGAGRGGKEAPAKVDFNAFLVRGPAPQGMRIPTGLEQTNGPGGIPSISAGAIPGAQSVAPARPMHTGVQEWSGASASVPPPVVEIQTAISGGAELVPAITAQAAAGLEQIKANKLQAGQLAAHLTNMQAGRTLLSRNLPPSQSQHQHPPGAPQQQRFQQNPRSDDVKLGDRLRQARQMGGTTTQNRGRGMQNDSTAAMVESRVQRSQQPPTDPSQTVNPYGHPQAPPAIGASGATISQPQLPASAIAPPVALGSGSSADCIDDSDDFERMMREMRGTGLGGDDDDGFEGDDDGGGDFDFGLSEEEIRGIQAAAQAKRAGRSQPAVNTNVVAGGGVARSNSREEELDSDESSDDDDSD